jgi:dihydrofolate synthase / folylpolyglutamate synthase
MLDRLLALESFGIKLGLTNISRLCEALDHPERACASLHVAGTNGKGSVTAMVHAALQASGVHAARYTSPHLVDLNERFVIGEEAVTDGDLESAGTRVLDCADALVAARQLPGPPTFFEATTAIAFELFRRARVQVAVLEVGLGGRFDATNVVHPVAAAITSIGFDHQEHLGKTLGEIAREKAGIIKPGVPVVAGALPPEAWPAVRRAAEHASSRLISAAEDSAVSWRMDGGRGIINVTTPHHHYQPIRLALRGEHQIGNAVVAIRLLEEARAAGIPITFDAIERGLAHTAWPARLEELQFHGGKRLVIDAAHNADGAEALARFLQRYHREPPPLVFAAMRDKDIPAILGPLLRVVGPVIVTRAPSTRASAPSDLSDAIRALDARRSVAIEPDPADAVERAWGHGPLVCVAGSIVLAGAVRSVFHPRAIVDSSP